MAASELDYGTRDFERVRTLIRSRAGIVLADAKREMAYSRLARLVRAGGHPRFSDYLDALEKQGGEEEWQAFVNAMTTNLTSFFRESHHFELLAQHLRRPGAPATQRIWCAAASTGEEPWSLLITACEAFDSLNPPVEILATDIDTACLATAARGVYPVARIEDIDAARRKRFFERGTGAQAGLVRILPQLAQKVRFARCNLLEPSWPLRGELDALFCRNVMIYFDKPTQLQLLRRMAPLLRDDGLFFAGHSESFFHAADVVRACGRTVYSPVRAQRAATFGGLRAASLA
jgi:chemotaxis protein methyltransferase CheR